MKSSAIERASTRRCQRCVGIMSLSEKAGEPGDGAAGGIEFKDGATVIGTTISSSAIERASTRRCQLCFGARSVSSARASEAGQAGDGWLRQRWQRRESD